MRLDEWEPIAAWLGALFPNFQGDEATVAAYFTVLADEDACDVEAACRYLASQHHRQFFPSVGEILGQAATERRVRVEHERIPDVTGIAALPEAEARRLLERGLAASYGVDADAAPELEEG